MILRLLGVPRYHQSASPPTNSSGTPSRIRGGDQTQPLLELWMTRHKNWLEQDISVTSADTWNERTRAFACAHVDFRARSTVGQRVKRKTENVTRPTARRWTGSSASAETEQKKKAERKKLWYYTLSKQAQSRDVHFGALALITWDFL